jgi:lipopolysaccharide transport system ATP-binding protein
VSPTLWALRDVSFDVPAGQVLGIIGRNGAGKTTLLKILSRITEPTTGEARVRGRVGALLEVGTGFHPELTGRENLYLNGAILGMSRTEIDARFATIVEFAGVAEFIDTPIKRYSTGMQVRLAFAVAAHLDPDVLFIDEVLSVGDAEFQRRSLDRMRDVTREGRTVILVSHDMTAIRRLCERVLLLDRGSVVLDGPAADVVSRYLSIERTDSAVIGEAELAERVTGIVERRTPTIRCLELALVGRDGGASTRFRSDEPITVRMTFECLVDIADLRLVVSVVDELGQPIVTSVNIDDPTLGPQHRAPRGVHVVECVIPPDLFGDRTVELTVELVNPKTEHLVFARVLRCDVDFVGYSPVTYGDHRSVLIRPRLRWRAAGVQEQLSRP